MYQREMLRFLMSRYIVSVNMHYDVILHDLNALGRDTFILIHAYRVIHQRYFGTHHFTELATEVSMYFIICKITKVINRKRS